MDFSESIIKHCELLYLSFHKLTGKKLIEEDLSGEKLAHYIYKAPFVIVSHGTETDPVFNYANLKAQELWEMDWKEFIKTPSRLSAEKTVQTERQKLLGSALHSGYISNYTGVRISRNGRKFHILDTTLWNLTDLNGDYKGQAAFFKQWKYLE